MRRVLSVNGVEVSKANEIANVVRGAHAANKAEFIFHVRRSGGGRAAAS